MNNLIKSRWGRLYKSSWGTLYKKSWADMSGDERVAFVEANREMRIESDKDYDSFKRDLRRSWRLKANKPK